MFDHIFQVMIRNYAKIAFKTLDLSKTQWAHKLPIRSFSAGANQLVNVWVNDQTGIATVTMNRKPVNGLSLELFEALSKTLDDLENNKCRGVILTSVRQWLKKG